MGTGKRFDGGEWVRRTTDRRTREALRKQDEEFISEHSADPDRELLMFIRKRAKELGYVPLAADVTGSRLMIERFGSWIRAVRLAGYRFTQGPSKLKNTKRYKKEYVLQQRLFKLERQEKKRLKAETVAAREKPEQSKRYS